MEAVWLGTSIVLCLWTRHFTLTMPLSAQQPRSQDLFPWLEKGPENEVVRPGVQMGTGE